MCPQRESYWFSEASFSSLPPCSGTYMFPLPVGLSQACPSSKSHLLGPRPTHLTITCWSLLCGLTLEHNLWSTVRVSQEWPSRRGSEQNRALSLALPVLPSNPHATFSGLLRIGCSRTIFPCPLLFPYPIPISWNYFLSK